MSTRAQVLFVRLPEDEVRWLRIHAAERGERMSASVLRILQAYRRRQAGLKSASEAFLTPRKGRGR